MSKSRETIALGDAHLSISNALALARGEARAVIGEQARARMEASQRMVAELAAGDAAVYGINTGFGPLCTTRVSAADTRQLQTNLLLSHASGTGPAIAPELVRLMLILKAHALARGHSGVSTTIVERILWQLDNDVIPQVPSQGSVGASGDLAPLAHLFLPLLGLGRVDHAGIMQDAADVLSQHGLASLSLGPKEGLALINGTQFMAAHAAAGLDRMQACLDLADLAGALSLEARLGSERPFGAALHATRPHPGAVYVARRLRGLLAGSQIMASHQQDCALVQDPYSLRCMPQIHGAARAAWLHLAQTVVTEINAVTDNPVVLDSGEAVSGGNFHGQPLALPLDYAVLAASELGNVSDRRSYLLLEGDGDRLPRLLLSDTGLQSGFMILQYTSAALASENKNLCFPASADSIPTSLGQEDHVSMGSIGGRKLHRVLDNLEQILAVELLCACQGLDFRRPLRSGPILEACHAALRTVVSHADSDRIFATDLAQVVTLIRSGRLLKAAKDAQKSASLDLGSAEQAEFFAC